MMAYTEAELAARAAATAAALLRFLRDEDYIRKLIDAYIMGRFRRYIPRQGKVYEDMLATISRETLLMMAAIAAERSAKYLQRRKLVFLKRIDTEAGGRFRQALARALAGSQPEAGLEERFAECLSLRREQAVAAYCERAAAALDKIDRRGARRAIEAVLPALIRAAEQCLDDAFEEQEPGVRGQNRIASRKL